MRDSVKIDETSAPPDKIIPGRHIRDYLWCIKSPPVVKAGAPGVYFPDQAFWADLNCPVPAQLPRPPDPNRFKLGYHFEHLVNAWAGQNETVEPLARNLQVVEDKRTLGGFDLLLRRNKIVEHWELAVKFYIGVGDMADPSRWFGPNTADRLDIKFGRMTSHQLQLSKFPAAKNLLGERNLAVSKIVAMVKGRLFYPWDVYATGRFTPPPFVADTHERGWWLQASALQKLADPDWRYVALPKSLWLAPIAPPDDVNLMDFEQLSRLVFDPSMQPCIHIAIVDKSGSELSRGFINHPRWLSSTNRPSQSTSAQPP